MICIDRLYYGILEFNKVTDLDSLADNRTGTYTDERSHMSAVLDLSAVALDAVENNAVADFTVLNKTVRTDGTAGTDRASETLFVPVL